MILKGVIWTEDFAREITTDCSFTRNPRNLRLQVGPSSAIFAYVESEESAGENRLNILERKVRETRRKSAAKSEGCGLERNGRE
jgi:hypothetical protein